MIMRGNSVVITCTVCIFWHTFVLHIKWRQRSEEKKLLRSYAHSGAHRQTQIRCSLASLYFILYIYFHRRARTMKENFSREPFHVSIKLHANVPIRRNTSMNWDDEISIQLGQPAAVLDTAIKLRASSPMSTQRTRARTRNVASNDMHFFASFSYY